MDEVGTVSGIAKIEQAMPATEHVLDDIGEPGRTEPVVRRRYERFAPVPIWGQAGGDSEVV